MVSGQYYLLNDIHLRSHKCSEVKAELSWKALGLNLHKLCIELIRIPSSPYIPHVHFSRILSWAILIAAFALS